MIKLNNIKDNTKYYDCSIYNQDEKIIFICFSSDNIGGFNYNLSDSDIDKYTEYFSYKLDKLKDINNNIDKVRWIKNVNDNIKILCFVPDICIRNIKDIENDNEYLKQFISSIFCFLKLLILFFFYL
jgi:hypothetical protein